MNVSKVVSLIIPVITGLVVFVIFLSIAAYFFLLLPPIQKSLFGLARQKIDSLIVGQLKTGVFSSNLISFVKLNDILITDSLRPYDSIYVKSVIVHFRLAPLLQKKISISSVTLDGVGVNLGVPFKGVLRVPVAPQKKAGKKLKKKSSWKLEINTITIKNLEACYTDSTNQFSGFISRCRIDGRFDRKDSITFKLKSPLGRFDSPWWSGKIDLLKTNGYITGEFLKIDDLILSGSGTNVKAGGIVPFLQKGKWDLSAHIVSSIAPLVLLKNFSQISDWGFMAADAFWKGTMKNPSLRLKVNAAGLKISGNRIDSVVAGGAYEKGILYGQLKMVSNKSIVSAKVESIVPAIFSDFAIKSYSAQVDVNGLNLILLKSFFPEMNPGTDKWVYFNFSARGSGFSFPKTVSINGRINGITVNPVLFSANMEDPRWNIRGQFGKGGFSGSGVLYNLKSIDGRFNAVFPDISSISVFLLKQKIEGSVSARAHVIGKISRPEISVTATGSKLRWKSLEATETGAKLDISASGVMLHDAYAKVTGGMDDVLRYYGIDSCGGKIFLDATAYGDLRQLNSWLKFRGTGVYYKKIFTDSVEGIVSILKSTKVNWDKLRILKGTSLLESRGSIVNGTEISLESAVQLKKRDKKGWNESGTADINGSINNNKISVKVTTDKFNLAVISPILSQDLFLKGSVSAVGDFEGTLRNPSGFMDIQVVGPGMGNFSAANAKGRFDLADSTIISRNLKIGLLDNQSEMAASLKLALVPGKGWKLDTSGSRESVISAFGNSFDIAGAAKFFGNGFRAKGSGFLKFTLINKKGPWLLDGNAKIKAGEVAYSPMDLIVSGVNLNTAFSGTSLLPVIRFSLTTGKANIRSSLIDSSIWSGRVHADTVHLDTGYAAFTGGGELRIKGSVPLVSFDSMFSHADPGVEYEMSKIPLKLIENFIPGISVKRGTLSGKGRGALIRGKLFSSGSLYLDKGLFTFDWLDNDIGPLTGNFSLNGDSLFIKELTGKMGKGKFNVFGNAALRRNARLHLDLRFEGKNLTLNMTDFAKVNLQSENIRIADSGNGYLISGKILLGTTKFLHDIRIPDMINLAHGENLFLKQNNPLQKWALMLTVVFQENLFVDMNLGNMQLDGNLIVGGTAASPRYVGEIRVIQGYVFYLDRQFDVSRGIISFVNPLEFNPVLDIAASSDVDAFAAGSGQTITYIINISVTGDVLHPVFVLSSTPPLSETDILGVLTLGAPLESAGGDVATRIGSLVGREILGFGATRIGKLLGLESVTLTGNVFSSGGAGPAVTLTKSISQRLTLTYQTGITNLERQRVSAILRLYPYLYLVGQTDQEGNANILLKYRISR